MEGHCQLMICLERITKEGETLTGFETRMETIVWGTIKIIGILSPSTIEKNMNYKDWKPQVWIPSQSHCPSRLWHNFVASCPLPPPLYSITTNYVNVTQPECPGLTEKAKSYQLHKIGLILDPFH